MFASERQKIIYDEVNKNGSVKVSELVEKFNVSVETIRRDLLQMEKENKLYRVFGGAVKIAEMKPFDDLSKRVNLHSSSKAELCNTAMQFIKDGDTIAVDAGSTAIAFCNALIGKFSRLTVVTHSLDVFNLLNNYKEFNVILCGGNFFKAENCFYGPIAIHTMSMLHVQKSFIFPAALSLQHGICDHTLETFSMQQELVKLGDTVHFLADSSKFECKELFKLDGMNSNYIIITDNGLSSVLKEMYEENGIRIYSK